MCKVIVEVTDGERMESLSMVEYESLFSSQRETQSLLTSIGGEGTMGKVAVICQGHGCNCKRQVMRPDLQHKPYEALRV